MSQYTANLQQSTLNTAVMPVVITAQCYCKILRNEHAKCLSTCFDEEVTKEYNNLKTNAQRPQMTQEEQCMTGQVQLTETIILASHASTQLDPTEARCLPLHQCTFATRPMNVQ